MSHISLFLISSHLFFFKFKLFVLCVLYMQRIELLILYPYSSKSESCELWCVLHALTEVFAPLFLLAYSN